MNRYYGRRIDELLGKARIFVDRAKLFNRDVELFPMSSYERMIVHAHFAQDPDIVTESEGAGKFRRLVVKISQKNVEEPQIGAELRGRL